MKRNITLASNRNIAHTEVRATSGAIADRADIATGEYPNGPTRELARRSSGTVEVRLLWRPKIGRVELAVHDFATETGFHIEVASGQALDAFYHPYAHAPHARQLRGTHGLPSSTGAAT